MYCFSQFNEGPLIDEFFKSSDNGYFIDIGAAGGVCLSNTFALSLKGWTGLLLEPNPFYFTTLLDNYNQMHGRVKLVNAAVHPKGGLTEFAYNPKWPSGIVRLEQRQYMGSYWLNVVTPQQLKELQDKCDFLSIDTDGTDTVIFPEMIKVYPSVRLVCVEHINDHVIKDEWHRLFKEYGFTLEAETPENFLAYR